MRQDRISASQPELNDVQWSAMQYVLGELSDEQTELFETAMADDVTLCEAVLTATQLTCGIALACKSPLSGQSVSSGVSMIAEPVPFNRPAYARFGVFAAAVVMSLTVLALATLNTRQGRNDHMVVDAATADALALLLQDASANDVNAELEELTVSDDSDSTLVAPEWLLTAVDLDAATASENPPPLCPDDETGVY